MATATGQADPAGGSLEHPGARVERVTRLGHRVTVGPLGDRAEELFVLFADVVARGDGYPHSAPLTRTAFEDTWVDPVTLVVGAVVDGALAGAYYLKPNQPGIGSHIANAGYVVDRNLRGHGIGEVLVADSIPRARLAGFDAVQFNWVFESNPARPLYERHGWREIGRVPDAVPRADGTREPAIVYWRAV